MTDKILFETIALNDQLKMARATINKPKTMNSIDLEIIDTFYSKLIEWQNDDSIALVLLDAEGEKAFCAGGDVVSLYHAIKDDRQGNKQSLIDFFGHEYRMNYLMHTYTKPILCWGHGYVMGGGKGLFAGCSHRVVTEKSIIAMPEVTIGLFPDVGGSWFLQRMPKPIGLFVGITGARINAADALYLNLADRFIEHENKSQVVNAIINAQWSLNENDNHQLLFELLQANETNHNLLPKSALKQNETIINQCCDASTIETIVNNISVIDTEDKWLEHAVKTLNHGAALTAKLVARQLHNSRFLSLSEIFQMELNLAMNCCLQGEFVEGVRALLVDKDNNPNWQYKTIESVDEAFVEQFFDYDWQGQHPLANIKTPDGT